MHRMASKAVTTGSSGLATSSAVPSASLHRAAPSCTVWTRVDPQGLGSGHPVGTSEAPGRRISLILAGWVPSYSVVGGASVWRATGAFRLYPGGMR